MNNSELHALFQAEEEVLKQAFKDYGLTRDDPDQERLKEYPDLLREVLELPDDELCEKLKVHIIAAANVEAIPPKYSGTAFHRCFWGGKLASMRLLLRAGAKTDWTPGQVSIALGEVPASPQMGDIDPFWFACRVGKMAAASA